MADEDSWLLKEDGSLNVGTECRQIIYHPNLNVLLVTTVESQVYVFDVNSGLVLQRCTLAGNIIISFSIKFRNFHCQKEIFIVSECSNLRLVYVAISRFYHL